MGEAVGTALLAAAFLERLTGRMEYGWPWASLLLLITFGFLAFAYLLFRLMPLVSRKAAGRAAARDYKARS